MRRKNDFYPTETELTRTMLEHVGIHVYGKIFEPCNGQGHISKELIGSGKNVITADIEGQQDHIGDATRKELWELVGKIDWTITNPPFNRALEILKMARRYSKGGVIFLLRITFLEPTYDRQDFLEADPPHMIIVNPRTSFTGDGKTDSTTTAWMFWNNAIPNEYPKIRITRKD